MERQCMNSGNWLNELYKRETALLPPRICSRRLSASQALIQRLGLYGQLNGHQGCVNAISFNSTGELLASGSDDRQIMLWEWAAETLKLSYQSGHTDNVFQAKFMPFTDDSKIISSSADCQVRLSLIQKNGSVETKRLSKHQGRVHSLAIEPGSPYVFYSCGEDGFVQHVGFLSADIHSRFPLNPSLRRTPFFCNMTYEDALLPSFSIALHSHKTACFQVLG